MGRGPVWAGAGQPCRARPHCAMVCHAGPVHVPSARTRAAAGAGPQLGRVRGCGSRAGLGVCRTPVGPHPRRTPGHAVPALPPASPRVTPETPAHPRGAQWVPAAGLAAGGLCPPPCCPWESSQRRPLGLGTRALVPTVPRARPPLSQGPWSPPSWGLLHCRPRAPWALARPRVPLQAEAAAAPPALMFSPQICGYLLLPPWPTSGNYVIWGNLAPCEMGASAWPARPGARGWERGVRGKSRGAAQGQLWLCGL